MILTRAYRDETGGCKRRFKNMKMDRLYAITVYLLNHGKTSAAELANK